MIKPPPSRVNFVIHYKNKAINIKTLTFNLKIKLNVSKSLAITSVGTCLYKAEYKCGNHSVFIIKGNYYSQSSNFREK